MGQPFLISMNAKPEVIDTSDFSFKKEERLCSKKVIDKLFEAGCSFLVYPLKVNYFITPLPTNFRAQAAFTVSKKLYKKAVHRNLIKRRMRESYRLNKSLLYSMPYKKQVVFFFIYVEKKITDYRIVETAMIKALKRIAKEINPKH